MLACLSFFFFKVVSNYCLNPQAILTVRSVTCGKLFGHQPQVYPTAATSLATDQDPIQYLAND